LTKLYNKSTSIIVVAAGISGLSVAYKLSKLGFNVTILEKQKFVGGISTSIEFNDNVLDIGPHILLLPESSKNTEEIKDLMGMNNLNEVRWPWAKSYAAGRLFEKSYPLLYDIFFNFGLKFFLKALGSVIFAKLKKSQKNSKFNSAEEYFVGNYGKFLYEMWFKPYFRTQCEDLSLEKPEFAKKNFRPISFYRFFKLFKKKLILKIKNPNPVEGKFHCYPKFGMIYFIEKIKESIQNNNGTIILGADITSINHEKNKKIISYIENGNQHSINCDIIIYTAPLPITINWFKNIPVELKNEISKSKKFHSIMVFLVIDKPKIFDTWVITVYDLNLKIFRVSQQTYLSDKVCEKGKTILCIEIQALENYDVWNMTDNELKDLVYLDLKKMKILHEEKIEKFKIIRLKNLYPIKKLKEFEADQIIQHIHKFDNEYFINTVTDPGRVGSIYQKSNMKFDASATGVYKAFLNADAVVRKIQEKNSM